MRADGQVNKNGTLEMRRSLKKSAFGGKRVPIILFALIKNYQEKDKRSITISRQLTHLLNVYFPIICQITFLIVLKTSFSLIITT